MVKLNSLLLQYIEKINENQYDFHFFIKKPRRKFRGFEFDEKSIV